MKIWTTLKQAFDEQYIYTVGSGKIWSDDRHNMFISENGITYGLNNLIFSNYFKWNVFSISGVISFVSLSYDKKEDYHYILAETKTGLWFVIFGHTFDVVISRPCILVVDKGVVNIVSLGIFRNQCCIYVRNLPTFAERTDFQISMPAGKRYILKNFEFDCFHMLFDTETAAVELYDNGDPSILFGKIPYEEYMARAK